MSLKKKWIKKEINQLSEIAGFLWERGWAERNGGNISINLSDKLKDISFDEKTPFITEKLPAESAEMIFLVTGTGCYIRTLISSPKKGACILKSTMMLLVIILFGEGNQKISDLQVNLFHI